MNASQKLALTTIYIVGVVTLPRRLGWDYGIAVFLGGVLVLAFRARPGVVLQRVFFLEPFVLGVLALTLFQPEGKRLFLAVGVKSSLCLAAAAALTTTTPFSALLDALRSLRVPSLVVTVFGLTYRYLFVLREEMTRMRRARQSRTFLRGRRIEWQLLASVASALFVRASNRAERIYQAMLTRGL